MSDGWKKKYINIFGSFTDPFNYQISIVIKPYHTNHKTSIIATTYSDSEKTTELVQCQKFAHHGSVIDRGKKGRKHFWSKVYTKMDMALLGVKSVDVRKEVWQLPLYLSCLSVILLLLNDAKCHIVSWPYLVCACCNSNRTTATLINFNTIL